MYSTSKEPDYSSLSLAELAIKLRSINIAIEELKTRSKYLGGCIRSTPDSMNALDYYERQRTRIEDAISQHAGSNPARETNTIYTPRTFK